MPTADDRRRRRQPHPSAVATRGLLATRKCVRDALATCLAQRLDTGPRALDQRPALILGGLEPDITMLADGNGDFTRAVGLELDGSRFGMGKRSQRYAMVVEDGVVTALNVEEGGGFSVSSAEHVLNQL